MMKKWWKFWLWFRKDEVEQEEEYGDSPPGGEALKHEPSNVVSLADGKVKKKKVKSRGKSGGDSSDFDDDEDESEDEDEEFEKQADEAERFVEEVADIATDVADVPEIKTVSDFNKVVDDIRQSVAGVPPEHLPEKVEQSVSVESSDSSDSGSSYSSDSGSSDSGGGSDD